MAVHPYVRSGLTAVAVTAAIGLLVLAFRVAETADDVQLPPGVESVDPAPGSIMRPQGDVSADLDAHLTGVLLLDGREVPEDQLDRVQPLGQVSFQPGPAKDVELFDPGEHTATVVFWDETEGRDRSRSFTWKFRVG